MSQDWTEKYRPKTLGDVIGNPKAVNELKTWAESWNRGIPAKRAVVLIGTPGIGKTTSAIALANDMGWGLLEMNASDQRTGDAIRSIALRGALTETFDDSGEYLNSADGGKKLIILDEADNLFGNADRGAYPAISELIKNTKQPIILIVNDFYTLKKKSAAVNNDTLQISFMRPSAISIARALKKVAQSEGLDISDESLKMIAENSRNDIRAAVRDLEALSLGKKKITTEEVELLSERIVKSSMYDLMEKIFRKSDANGSRMMMRSIDEEPSYVLLWVDENLPYEYRDKGDLVRGYETLSRADIFLGRVSRRQYYGFWSYATDLMTAGVATGRRTANYNRSYFKFPTYLMKMSRMKNVKTTKKTLCQKLADHLHTSTKRVSTDVIPLLKALLACDQELRIYMVRDVGLDADELAFLLNSKVDSKSVKDAIAGAEGPAIQKIEIPDEIKPAEKPKPKAQKSLFEF